MHLDLVKFRGYARMDESRPDQVPRGRAHGREEGLFDCLMHLDTLSAAERTTWVDTAVADGVWGGLEAGVDPRSAVPDDPLSAGFERVRAYGLHPQAIDPDRVDEQLAALAHRLDMPGVVAIGEIGLDARPAMPPRDVQEVVLERQLALARERQLPVIVHCVQALGRLIALLERFGPLPRGGVLHGFGGPAELIARLEALDLDFSVGPLVMQPRALKCRRAVPAIPAARLLVETDAPGHAPGEPPGSRNLPAVVRAVAELRRQPYDEVARLTTRNAIQRFRLPSRP